MRNGSTFTPLGRLAELVHRHPERTATRHVQASILSALWGDVEIRTWSSRAAMLRTIDREDGQPGGSRWRPVVKGG